MLLRTRVMLVVALALAGVLAVLALALWQQDRMARDRLADIGASRQTALWHSVLNAQMTPVMFDLHRVADDPRLAEALAAGAPDRLAEILRQWLSPLIRRDLISEAQILGADGRPLADVRRQPTPPLLSAEAVARVRKTQGVAQGLVRRGDDLLAVLALAVDRAVVVLARPVDRALGEIGGELDARTVVLDLKGRAITGNGALWRQLARNADLTPGALPTTVWADGRIESVVATPVHGLDGRPLAWLVTVSDATEAVSDRRRFIQGVLGAAGAVVVAILVGLFVYLRRAFRPLAAAVAGLDALAAGERDLPLPAGPPAHDEVGHILIALIAYRDSLIALDRLKAEREDLRRRQQDLIRSQMIRLADSLDPERRSGILDDLDAVEQAGGDLAPLATTLERLAARVIDQHERLNRVVDDLHEALKTRQAFIALQKELDIARRVQLSILPRSFPVRPDCAVDGRMLPAKEVGGDFYDYFFLDDRRLAVAIADVSGKGVPGAFFMAIARTLLRAVARLADSPGECLARLNDLLAEDNPEMMFVTLFYGVLDLGDGTLRYASAGHDPPVVAPPEGAPEFLPRVGGPALGAIGGLTYDDSAVTLAPRTTLFLYTDGITEAMTPQGTLFGRARVRDLVAGDPEPAAVIDRVLTSVDQHRQGTPAGDDITCLAVRRR